jgi:hypothetical protein
VVGAVPASVIGRRLVAPRVGGAPGGVLPFQGVDEDGAVVPAPAPGERPIYLVPPGNVIFRPESRQHLARRGTRSR